MKAKIKSTGEVIEVSRIENIITKRGVESQYVDNKRSWCTYVQSELEFIKEEPHKNIDWEQRRYEIAKDMMTAAEQHNNDTTGFKNTMAQAQYAIECADALIAELMKSKTEKREIEQTERIWKIEIPIGGEYKYNGKSLICTEKGNEEDCCECAFLVNDDCTSPTGIQCYKECRKDGKNVIFVEKGDKQ